MAETGSGDPTGAECLRGCKVLVVEDEFHLATRITRALQKAQAKVLGPTAREDHALALIETVTPSCAFVDINLGNGLQFKIADRLNRAEVPFLFVTGYDNVMIPQRFDGIGRIRKPVSCRLILQAAAQMCLFPPESPSR